MSSSDLGVYQFFHVGWPLGCTVLETQLYYKKALLQPLFFMFHIR